MSAAAGDPEDVDGSVEFVVRLGRALHRYGAPSHRLEEALVRVSERLGLTGQFFATPTSVFAAFGPTGRQRMVLERFDPGEVHLGKLAEIDDLLEDAARPGSSLEEAERRLAGIEPVPPPLALAPTAAAHGLVAGSAAYFFGGSTTDLAVSAAVGVMVGAFVALLGMARATRRLVDLSAPALAALLAGLAGTRFADAHPHVITLAAVLILLPGLSLTTATVELASRHYVAGASRFAGTGVVLLTLGFGAALGTQLASRAFGPPLGGGGASPLAAWFVLPALLASAVGLAVSFRAKRRDFPWVLSSGVVTYFAVQAGAHVTASAELGALFGAFVLGLLGSLVARAFHRPAAIVNLPGLILLVPGSVGFRSIASLVQQDTLFGIQTAFSMLLVAVAIVTGLLVANAVLPSRRAL